MDKWMDSSDSFGCRGQSGKHILNWVMSVRQTHIGGPCMIIKKTVKILWLAHIAFCVIWNQHLKQKKKTLTPKLYFTFLSRKNSCKCAINSSCKLYGFCFGVNLWKHLVFVKLPVKKTDVSEESDPPSYMSHIWKKFWVFC